MVHNLFSISGAILLALSLFGSTGAQAQKVRMGTGAVVAGVHQGDMLTLGQAVYERHCSGCHGLEGNGEGPAARWLDPKPRDFTLGTFKFRTTPTGALPTDNDLFRTITEGAHGTSMPSWRILPEIERRAVVQYLKTFSDAWEDEDYFARAIAMPAPPTLEELSDPDRIKRGRTIFTYIGCRQCHGDTGAGDGPSSAKMKDDKGYPIRPANFQRGILRGGRRPADLFRAISTGYSGTPMPGFTMLKEEQLWDLVGFLRYLMIHQGDPENQDKYPRCTVMGNCEAAAAGTDAPEEKSE